MYRGKHSGNSDWSRRRFLQTAGSLVAFARSEVNGVAAVAKRGVSLVVNLVDPVASAPASLWAAKELEDALKAHDVIVLRCQRVAQANAGDLCLVVAGLSSPLAVDVLKRTKMNIAAAPEALAIFPCLVANRKVTLVCGYDPRGIVYALLDLADRVWNASSDPIIAMESASAIAERPANQARSITRLFVSDIHDKPWYNDREMWPHYLTMLATQRFNRFNLAFGIGYDFIRNVTDAYFLFTYPFLVNVPGYNVRVPQLPDAERDHNLEMLRFISEQTIARGLEFHVGLWMHGYEWINSPNANYYLRPHG
jgi:hypothetical protein